MQASGVRTPAYVLRGHTVIEFHGGMELTYFLGIEENWQGHSIRIPNGEEESRFPVLMSQPAKQFWR